MASASEVISILIKADGASARRELEKVGDTAKREMGKADKATRNWSATFTKTGTQLVAGAAVGAVGLYKLGEAASDLGESVNKSSVIFDEASASVEAFADSASKIGLSKRAALDAASGFGTLFVGVGKSETEAAEFSKTLTGLAADLASFNNTTVDEAVTALGAGLRGEAEPLRRFGVLLDEATLKQQALEMGLISTTSGTLPQSIKVQAAYGAILEQTTRQQGDFARTSDSLANQQRKLSAEWENLQAQLGSGVLPLLTQVTGSLSGVLETVTGLPDPVKKVAGSLAGVAVVSAAAGGAMLLAAGQARRLRDALTQVGADGSRSLNKVGKAAAGLAAVGAAVELGKVLKDIFVGTAPDTKEVEGQLRAIGSALFSVTDDAETTRQKILALDREFAAFVVRGPEIEALNLAGLQQDLDNGVVSAHDLNVALLGTEDQFRAFIDRIDSSDPETKALESWRRELQLAAEQTVTAQRAAGDYTAAQVEAATAATRAEGGTTVWTLALQTLTGDLNAATEATTSLRTEQRKMFEDVTNRRDAILGQRDAVRGVTESQLDLADAQDDLTTAQDDYNAAVKEFGPESREALAAQRAVQRAFIDVSAASDGAKGSVVKLAEEFLGDNPGPRAIQKTIDKLEGVRDTLAPDSPLRQYLDKYIRELTESIPDEVATKLRLDISTNYASGAGTGNEVVIRQASGGPVKAGMEYRVNEFGQEFFRPSVPGIVIPSHKANQSSGGGSFTHVVVNIQGDVNTEIDFERKVRAALASTGRRGG